MNRDYEFRAADAVHAYLAGGGAPTRLEAAIRTVEDDRGVASGTYRQPAHYLRAPAPNDARRVCAVYWVASQPAEAGQRNALAKVEVQVELSTIATDREVGEAAITAWLAALRRLVAPADQGGDPHLATGSGGISAIWTDADRSTLFVDESSTRIVAAAGLIVTVHDP